MTLDDLTNNSIVEEDKMEIDEHYVEENPSIDKFE
jgi:hypothetical protein